MMLFTLRSSGRYVVDEKTCPATIAEARAISSETVLFGEFSLASLADRWFSIHDQNGFILKVLKGRYLLAVLCDTVSTADRLSELSVSLRTSYEGKTPSILFGYCYINEKLQDVYSAGVEYSPELERSIRDSFVEALANAGPNSYARLYCAEINEGLWIATNRVILEDYSKMDTN